MSASVRKILVLGRSFVCRLCDSLDAQFDQHTSLKVPI